MSRQWSKTWADCKWQTPELLGWLLFWSCRVTDLRIPISFLLAASSQAHYQGNSKKLTFIPLGIGTCSWTFSMLFLSGALWPRIIAVCLSSLFCLVPSSSPGHSNLVIKSIWSFTVCLPWFIGSFKVSGQSTQWTFFISMLPIYFMIWGMSLQAWDFFLASSIQDGWSALA
jgi:hypothetical protein